MSDEEKQTVVQYNRPSPKFEETYDFHIVTTLNEMKTMKILIAVWHKTKFYQRDVLIGNLSVDVWNVFSKPNKMINKVWGGLEKENVLEPGFLNYTVLVAAENDKVQALAGDNDDHDDPDDPDQKNRKNGFLELIEGVPPLERKTYLMTINIYKGDFVKKLPGIKELNAKFKIIVNEGDAIENVAIVNSFTPNWKEQYNIPMKYPFYINFVVIEIYHEA